MSKTAPDVKLETAEEDVKDLNELFEQTRAGENEASVLSASNLWSFLVTRARFLHQKEHGKLLQNSHLVKILLEEVNQLLSEVNRFIKECCDPLEGPNNEDAFEVNGLVALSLACHEQRHFKVCQSMPQEYEETLFSPFMETQVPLPYYSPANEDDLEEIIPSVSDASPIEEDDPKIDEDIIEEETPIKTNGKKQKRYRCDKCGRSWAYRKGVVYHRAKGKCSKEPRWIRWTRGRPLCIHPDCAGKEDVEFTYSAMMKHIIEVHTNPESSSLQCNECPQKFPMTVVLKYHQEIVHQAHAKICTICGKMVSDMRKHKLVHTGEKPFQCDKCDFRCGRSSTLKRHMYTHSDSNEGRVHKCDICDKAFYEPHVLKEHKLTHEKIKPYQCKLCPDVFSNYSGHRQHMMRAHGQKFTCEICGKDSYTMRGLNIHKRDHHGIPI